jgi:acetylornithine deacetylase/succinyl-diaminopimelate desuccinylase-like protein
MGEKVLVTVELRFITEDDPKQLGERVREAVSMVVGRERLEEFRVRVIPLAPPKKPRAV